MSIETIVQWLPSDECCLITSMDQALLVADPAITANCGGTWKEEAMYMLFATRPYGRIILHIVAMLRNGEIRWHCAGIAREVMS